MKVLFRILDELFYCNGERLPGPLATLRAFLWRQVCGPAPLKEGSVPTGQRKIMAGKVDCRKQCILHKSQRGKPTVWSPSDSQLVTGFH